MPKLLKFIVIVGALGYGVWWLAPIIYDGEYTSWVAGALIAVIAFLAFGGVYGEAENTADSAQETDTSRDGSADRTAVVRALTKNKRYFVSQKHLTGIPDAKPKARFDIALEDDGISFYEAADKGAFFTIPWGNLVSVETTDAQAQKQQASNNAFKTAAYGSNKASVGGIMFLEAFDSMTTKHPLVIRYKASADDDFIAPIVFDTFDNQTIADKIISVRSGLMKTKQSQAPAVEASVPMAIAAPANSSHSVIDQIERLSALLDRGHLTPEEFAAQKAVILGGVRKSD